MPLGSRLGQLHGIGRVHFKILLRSSIRRMGPPKANCEKERFFASDTFLEVFNRSASDRSIGCFFIRRFEPFPIDRMLARSIGFTVFDDLIVSRSLANFPNFYIPRSRVFMLVA